MFIQCESCTKWLHVRCVGLNQQSLPPVYVCIFCTGSTPVARGGRVREPLRREVLGRDSPLGYKSGGYRRWDIATMSTARTLLYRHGTTTTSARFSSIIFSTTPSWNSERFSIRPPPLDVQECPILLVTLPHCDTFYIKGRDTYHRAPPCHIIHS
jgi:hypothetical protein